MDPTGLRRLIAWVDASCPFVGEYAMDRARTDKPLDCGAVCNPQIRRVQVADYELVSRFNQLRHGAAANTPAP